MPMTMLVFGCMHAALHSRHVAHALCIKNDFLLRSQLPIKHPCGFGMLLHVCITLLPHCLHLVKAFGRCHFFKSSTIRVHRMPGFLHGLNKTLPSCILRSRQIQLGMQCLQMLGMTISAMLALGL